MDLTLPITSLKHKALGRISKSLYFSEVAFLTRPAKDIAASWPALCSCVSKKVNLLDIPERLKVELLLLLKPIGDELRSWIRGPASTVPGQVYMLDDQLWTPHNTISRELWCKTLISNESVEIKLRYKWACYHGLESDIRALWGRMKPEQFHGKNLREIERREDPLTAFWCCFLENQVYKLHNLYVHYYFYEENLTDVEFGLELALNSPLALKCLWNKLGPVEKKRNIIRVAEKVLMRSSSADGLIFLLSQMTREEQMEMLQYHCRDMLDTLLHWPYQDIFLRSADILLDFMTKEEFLSVIESSILFTNYKTEEIFHGFWHRAPVSLKEYALDDTFLGELMAKLIKLDLVSCAALVWESVDVSERDLKFVCICYDLVVKGRWEIIKILLQVYIPSPNALNKLKRQLNVYAQNEDLHKINYFNGWTLALWSRLLDNIDNRFI